MENSTARVNIEATALKVRNASSEEKKHFSREEITNRFLDKILELKKVLKIKIQDIEDFVVALEELTWYDIHTLDTETQSLLNDVINATKDWSISLHKNHSQCVDMLKDNLSIQELEELKSAIDDLDEATLDLEKSVIYYPNDPDFIKITKELKRS